MMPTNDNAPYGGVKRTVTSSHGELTINDAGFVIACRADNTPDGQHLAAIRNFNLLDWLRYYKTALPSRFDILDLGYWYCAAPGIRYEQPEEDWRLIHTALQS